MASGPVELVNLALSILGASPIQSLDEASAEAVCARAQYDPARRAALRSYNWAFALKRAHLVRVDESVPGSYRYTYQLPADCLRPVRLIVPSSCGRPFSAYPVAGFEPAGNRRILCDLEDPVMEYVADVTDTTLFDDLFVQSFAYRLAAALAAPVAGNANLAQALMGNARQLEREAAAQSGRERRDPATVNIYVEARM